MIRVGLVLSAACACLLAPDDAASAAQAAGPKAFTNSIGMKLVPVPAGSFRMGQAAGGDFDEGPVHTVTISRSFRMSATEVTNAQYEQFDPSHKKLRGKSGLSKGDDEAVVFVSWHDAVAFCRWLGEKEGKPCRLPTEAEWEYACRAGTTTPYHTGDKLPKAFQRNQHDGETPKPVSLRVGAGAANPWGLHDMHGNVEEWCSDGYGPYVKGDQTDPVGRVGGDFRVARGGSHNTDVRFLRSANRSGTLPADRHWLIGFRVVMGAAPKSKAMPAPEAPLWARRVAQKPCDWSGGLDSANPYFEGPITYVKVPPGSNGPMFSRHNHDPGLAYCPNGDLLAIWYTCNREPGRELGILASRLRRGAKRWEPASPFWDAPDRNDHAPAIWYDGKGTLYHFNGLSAGPGYRKGLALVLRTSTDSGATWSPARLINPERGLASQPVTTVFRARDGRILLPVDAFWLREGGATALWMSADEGKTWSITDTGSTGIHAGFVQLTDGRLLSFGRYRQFESTQMPQSLSRDMGKTWTRSDSQFPPVSGGQRLVLMRLREGAILLVSFTDPNKNGKRGIVVPDAAGGTRRVYGMYAAVSFDEGKTWPVKKLITPGGPAREMDGLGNTHKFTMDETRAEPRGYLAATQTPDGVIHLISSALHYRFNLAWINTPAPEVKSPAAAAAPKAAELALKALLASVFVPRHLPGVDRAWRFTGSGVREADAVSFPGGVMRIDTGKGQRARWVSASKGAFGSADRAKGHTAEIRMQVLKSTSRTRGIDLETYVGDGTKRGRRCMVTVTGSGVYWLGGAFAALAEGLDNHSAMHTYRLAVRGDGTAQIYRDGRLLGVRRAAGAVDSMVGAKGPYLQWGEGAGGSEADAKVAHVAYDLGGAFAPEAPEQGQGR